ncbi:unnamed protein product, partial [Rhizoctonia solani]
MVTLDPVTQSNYAEITTRHVHFDWLIDWKLRRISGSATHELVANQDNVKQVILDTSHLEITGVEVSGIPVKYDLKQRHPVMGSALVVSLPSTPHKGGQIALKINYNTTTQCTAVGWLDKEQTYGKKFEYLFSQCQPTYSSSVTSILPVLMSALRVSPPSDGPVHEGKEVGAEPVKYQYNQVIEPHSVLMLPANYMRDDAPKPIPIPSYLIAIASGNVIYKPFASVSGCSWKTGVWTEPEQMDAAFWEFNQDTANYVHEAEKMLTPYEFGVYDLLLLPPSFPYGGMENACLTFVTPTLLAGDRSLVDVVAHEISHSWFGNNVSCADSGHFWLNEMPLNITKYQRLVIDYAYGEDPDDAYSSVPYEKGSNFLLYLERLLGGLDVFLPYARDYVNTFRGRSIRTDEWKTHLFDYFEKHGGEDKLKL